MASDGARTEGASAALTLSSVGLALQALAGILALWFGYWSWYGYGPFPMGPWMMGAYYGAPPAYGPHPLYAPYLVLYAALAAIVLAVGAIGVALMGGHRSEGSRVRAGAILVIVAAVIAFPTMFGFIVGSLLMLIGGVLGLVEVHSI